MISLIGFVETFFGLLKNPLVNLLYVGYLPT